MRGINLTNDKKRDAKVAFDSKTIKSSIKMVLPDGSEKNNVRFVKTTVNEQVLISKYKNIEDLGNDIIKGDPELDAEITGCLIDKTNKLYVTEKGEIIYRLERFQVVYDAQGNEKERRPFSALPANVNTDIPLVWSGKEFPKKDAVRKFVFSRNYQLRHTSGISYDFLYGMAKQLHDNDTLMLLGAGKKGAEPLVLNLGGKPYRGFLEGRIEGESYALILHLSNMELRS